MINYIGNAEFDDVFEPIKGKNEWGIDTLTRKVRGARPLAAAYLAGLTQGQRLSDSEEYYLQSWEPDDNPIWAEITLNYKGLLYGTPLPDIQNEITPAVGQISKNFATENFGKGRIYRKQPLWKLALLDFAGETVDEVVATRDVYTTGASMEFTYDAIQTVYRYISEGRPTAPRFYTVDIPRIPTIKRARIVTADGAVYGRNAPGLLTADLEPIPFTRVVGFVSKNIFGTPFWECQDTVRRELGESESDTEGSFAG